MSEIKIYGESLHAAAKEDGVADIILSELKSISELFNKNPEYVQILDSPQIERSELMEILNQDFFGRVHKYTLNFLKILCEKRMVHYIGECLGEYERLYNADNNITVVNVTTAKPMSEEIAAKLITKLEKKTGGRIVLKRRVDESCIGGIIIESDGMRLDSSLRSELSNLKQTLVN